MSGRQHVIMVHHDAFWRILSLGVLYSTTCFENCRLPLGNIILPLCLFKEFNLSFAFPHQVASAAFCYVNTINDDMRDKNAPSLLDRRGVQLHDVVAFISEV